MIRVLGVDPGPTTGLCLLEWRARDGLLLAPGIVQCSHKLTADVVDVIVRAGLDEPLLSVERFVVGRKSMRAGADGEITRNLIGGLTDRYGAHMVQQPAADAKTWATDRRLDAAGLLEATAGMRHARDAARHALFASVKYAGMPDPLSRKAKPA